MERNRQVSCPEVGGFPPYSFISYKCHEERNERKGKGRRCRRCFVSWMEEGGHGEKRNQEDRGGEDQERLGHE